MDLSLKRSGQAVSVALRKLLESAPLRAQMGIAARKKVETFFNWDAIADRTEQFYLKLLAERQKSERCNDS